MSLLCCFLYGLVLDNFTLFYISQHQVSTGVYAVLLLQLYIFDIMALLKYKLHGNIELFIYLCRMELDCIIVMAIRYYLIFCDMHYSWGTFPGKR